jgi:hypothetical protein
MFDGQTGIDIGLDLGGTGHAALNFTGSTGSAGDTWITVYDPAPPPPSVTFGSVGLSADVLIHTFNNKKGAGLLALYNEAPSKKGLALMLYDAGGTDTLVLATVDQAGKLVTLKTVRLGACHHRERVVPRQHGCDGRRRPRKRRRHRVQARGPRPIPTARSPRRWGCRSASPPRSGPAPWLASMQPAKSVFSPPA